MTSAASLSSPLATDTRQKKGNCTERTVPITERCFENFVYYCYSNRRRVLEGGGYGAGPPQLRRRLIDESTEVVVGKMGRDGSSVRRL